MNREPRERVNRERWKDKKDNEMYNERIMEWNEQGTVEGMKGK